MFKIFGILVANRVGVKGDLITLLWSPNFQFFTIFFKVAQKGENYFIKLTRAGETFRGVKSILGKNRLSDSSHFPSLSFLN